MAVSDHVFHRLPFDLLIQVSATKLSKFLCIPFVLMTTDRACEDAMPTSLLGSPPLSSNVGSHNGSGHDFDGMGNRSRNTSDAKLHALFLKTRGEIDHTHARDERLRRDQQLLHEK